MIMQKVMEVIFIKKDLHILECGKIIVKMEKEKKFGLIKQNMKVIIKKEKNGVKGN